jgi:hypothetical protein
MSDPEMVMVLLDDDSIYVVEVDETAKKFIKDKRLIIRGHEAWYKFDDKEVVDYLEKII